MATSGKIRKKNTRKLAIIAITAIIAIVVLLFVTSNQETVARVDGREITQLDVNRLGGASSGISESEKVSLIADSYLYSAILERADLTYDEEKVKQYSNNQLAKEWSGSKDSGYHKQKYLTDEQKKRVERYLSGGFIANYILIRYDQNFSVKDFSKISQDLLFVEELKADIQSDISKSPLAFSQIEKKIAAEIKRAGSKTRATISKGKLSSLGAIDDSNEQVVIAQALRENQVVMYGDSVYKVDIYQKTSEGKFPGKTLIYKTDKTFHAPIASFREFINQQKQKLGYEKL